MSQVKQHDQKISGEDEPAPGTPGPRPPENTGLRPPQQGRSKASLDRVLAAGADVLAEGGYAAFTINEVARRAGASTGLIYARFAHKAALFEAVLVRETTRIVDEENTAIQALAQQHPPTADLIAGIVRILAGIAHREAPLTRAFMERTTVEPTLIHHVKRLRTAPQRIVALLLERHTDLHHDNPERAADMAIWIAISALERRVHTDMWRHWRPHPDTGWDTFVTDLITVLQTFLLPPPHPTTPKTPPQPSNQPTPPSNQPTPPSN